MKIGISTFWQTKDNYGQILQCWALQQALIKQGHAPFLIRYTGVGLSRKPPINFVKKVKKIIKNLPKYYQLWRMLQMQQQYNQQTDNAKREFEAFKNQELRISAKIYDAGSIHQTPPEADLYICGSDQIWGDDSYYYLDFVPNKKKKIAYAVSMGADFLQQDSEFKAWMQNLIKDFSSLGMREDVGVKACQELGRADAKVVVDPTMLLMRHDYELIRQSSGLIQKYLFLYIIGNPIDLRIEEVYTYARKVGLEVVYVAVQGQCDSYPKAFPKIGEWLDLIDNAELVVTNSFHGTVFSLIYETPFVVVPAKKFLSSKNIRIEQLLSNTSLSHRMYSESVEKTVNSSCDFQGFRSFVEMSRQEAYQFLSTSISY